MTKLATIAGVFCASLGTCAIGSDQADAPQAGTYEAQMYVQSAGNGCLDTAGYSFVGSASFAGLDGAKHYLRIPYTGVNLAVVSVQTLAVTSGKGTTQLAGNLTWTGNGVGQSWSYKGTFTAAITEIGRTPSSCS